MFYSQYICIVDVYGFYDQMSLIVQQLQQANVPLFLSSFFVGDLFSSPSNGFHSFLVFPFDPPLELLQRLR